MKISFSRRSILAALAIAIILLTLPAAISRLLRTGDLYLFTRHFFEDMAARLSGPGRLRFILQPIAAALVCIRDGKKDARYGCPPFLLALAYSKTDKPNLLRNALASIRDLIAIAIILDLVSQFLIFREVHPGAALLMGPVLIAVPYAVSRALANRILRRRSQQAPAIHPS